MGKKNLSKESSNNENTKSDFKKKKIYSTWEKRRKIQKLSSFKLTDEEKILIKSNKEELRNIALENIDKKIIEYQNEIANTIQKIKDSTNEDEKVHLKKHKKYIVIKLKKIKAASKNEDALASKVKNLSLRKKKLRRTKNKIDRRLGELKNSLKRCLKCKKRGHVAENCPFGDDNIPDEKEEKICYNCGSTEHNLYQCKLPVDYNNLKFALCFKCKKRGHISANCPLNENGIYYKGGSCYICGKKDHLAKNCPEKQGKIN